MSQILIVFLSAIFGFYTLIIKFYSQWISSISRIPHSDWLLVLGAGVENNNKPTPILKDRLISTVKYVKRNFLLSEGIERDSIFLDELGFSTYHSCMNMKNKYDPVNIVIISQRFHLYRSLMISRLIGLQSFGLVADNISFSNTVKTFWYFREGLAIPYNLIKMLLLHLSINQQ